MATLEEILLLVLAVIVLALCLILADKIIGEKQDFSGGLFLQAVLTAIIIIVLIIAVGVVVGLVDILGIGQIAPILAFVGGCYAIKMLFLKDSSFEKSVWLGVITWVLVYIINYIGNELGAGSIVNFI